MTTRRLLLAAILLVCLVGRGAYVLYLVHEMPDVTTEGDSASYLGPAEQLRLHGRFDLATDPPEPAFLRTPGYPIFIAAVSGVFGDSLTALLLAQVVLSTLTVFVAYLLAARIWSVPIGLLAALFTALEPLQNYTSATIVTECLEALLLLVVAAVGFAAFSKDPLRPWRFALLGLVLAVATLNRPTTYYFPVLVVALLLVRSARHHRRWRVFTRLTVAFLLPLVVLVGGWQVRNHEQVDSWQFSGIEAKGLYEFRAAGVIAENSGISFADAQHRLRTEFGLRGHERVGPYYNRMRDTAMDILLAHPGDVLVTTAQGLARELFSVRLKFFTYLGYEPATGSVELAALILLLGFYAMCAYGMVLVVRRRRDLAAHAFVIGLAVYVLLVSAGPETIGGRGERFRAPVMPILILYAAFGAYELTTSVRRTRLWIDRTPSLRRSGGPSTPGR